MTWPDWSRRDGGLTAPPVSLYYPGKMMYSSTTRCLAASKWHPSSAGSARRLSVVTSLMYPSASARHHYRFVSLSLYKPQVICPITTFNAIVQRSHSSSSLNEQPPSATYSKLSNTTIQAITTTSKTDDETRVKILPLGDGIVHVLLSRPKKMNSLDMSMFESIAEAAMMLKEDRDVRVVIVSGEFASSVSWFVCSFTHHLLNPPTNIMIQRHQRRGASILYRFRRKECSTIRSNQIVESFVRASFGVWGRVWIRQSGSGCWLLVEVSIRWCAAASYGWCLIKIHAHVPFRQLPVPVIAVLHGMCFGGGRFPVCYTLLINSSHM